MWSRNDDSDHCFSFDFLQEFLCTGALYKPSILHLNCIDLLISSNQQNQYAVIEGYLDCIIFYIPTGKSHRIWLVEKTWKKVRKQFKKSVDKNYFSFILQLLFSFWIFFSYCNYLFLIIADTVFLFASI